MKVEKYFLNSLHSFLVSGKIILFVCFATSIYTEILGKIPKIKHDIIQKMKEVRNISTFTIEKGPTFIFEKGPILPKDVVVSQECD